MRFCLRHVSSRGRSPLAVWPADRPVGAAQNTIASRCLFLPNVRYTQQTDVTKQSTSNVTSMQLLCLRLHCYWPRLEPTNKTNFAKTFGFIASTLPYLAKHVGLLKGWRVSPLLGPCRPAHWTRLVFIVSLPFWLCLSLSLSYSCVYSTHLYSHKRLVDW